MSGDIKYSLISVLNSGKRMSIVALIWCEEMQKLRDRTSQKEEQRQGLSSTEEPAALMGGMQNNSNKNFVAAKFEKWLSRTVLSPSSSAIYNMMECFQC